MKIRWVDRVYMYSLHKTEIASLDRAASSYQTTLLRLISGLCFLFVSDWPLGQTLTQLSEELQYFFPVSTESPANIMNMSLRLDLCC